MPPSPRPSALSTPSLGDVPQDPGGRASFVRHRLTLFGKTVSWIAVTFLGLAALLDVFGVMPFWRPGMESHLLATIVAFAIWQLPRRTALGPAALDTLDTLGTLAICVSLVVMGHRYAADQPWGAFAGIFAVFHVTMARAIIVPSTPRRTLIVTALSFAGLVVSQQLMPGAPRLGDPRVPVWLAVIPSMTWSATVTALATVASRVIYGLQERVFEARRLGQYTLQEKIGSGGMGEVYRASHAMLRRPTAIKLLSRHVSDEHLRRFEKEVQLTACLTHPNTISIYDYGRTPNGTFYYVMELLDGLTLEQLVEEHGPQRPSRVIHILLQACGALREAHEAGLSHRDIKPANAVLCFHGGLPDVLKVLDFGLVKEIGTDAPLSKSDESSIVGTPLFMAPEEISSPGAVGARSDLYSLGAVAYYLLSGAPVFDGKNVIEVCSHHLHTPPAPLSERTAESIPADLERIIMDCLAKSPEARPSSAFELSQRLQTCADRGGWSEAEARLWWETRVERRGSPGAKPASHESRTIRVDLETRLGSAP